MATATARRPGVGRGGGRRGGAAALLLVLCAGCLAAGEVSCIKFRMFPQLNPKECVSESVSAHQWDLVLESVEANFRKAAKRNLTDHEVAVRLASFRRPVTIEVGFITMSPNPVDQTMKPIDYVITDDRGNMLNTRTSITQEEVDWKGHVGGRGPYTICFTANKEFGVVEVDLTYFHINVPGAKHAKISGELTEEDIRDMKPVITDEELKYFAQEEHVMELKGDMRKVGTAVYQAYYEQQHIKQILHRQHRGIWSFAVKVKVLGYAEAFFIVLCSVLQYVFVRRLFKGKGKVGSFRGGFEI